MDTAEYRAAHGLSTSLPLISPAVKQLKSERARAQYPDNLGLREAPRDARWRRRHRIGVKRARAENLERPGFQAAWREAIEHAAASRSRSSRRRYDDKAVALGYRDLKQLLAKTWPLTDVQFGQLLGISESNAGYVRANYGRRPDVELEGVPRRSLQYIRGIDRRYDERAQAAGYSGITEMLDRTRDLLNRELAQALGISAQAASRLRSDPSMARLRPGRGKPIKETPDLRRRRAERNKGQTRPANGKAQQALWKTRHETAARSLGYASIEEMINETIELSTNEFGALIGVSDETASKIRRDHAGIHDETPRLAGRVVTQMRYDSKARALGYPDMATLLTSTVTLTIRQLQTLLGVSMGTAHRLRTQGLNR